MLLYNKIILLIQCDTILSPIIDTIKVVMKKSLQKSAGSLNMTIPTKTVPTAPIPVHTAYAVPIGNSCVALRSNNMLIARQIINPPYQYVAIIPVDSFAIPRQAAKPTSNRPAMINKIQFIDLNSYLLFHF